MKNLNNAEGLFEDVLTSCSLAAGVFKSNLTKDERESFKKLFTPQFPASANLTAENENVLFFYLPLPGGGERVNPLQTGGACVISWKDMRESVSVEPTSVMQELNGSWAAAMIDGGKIFLGRDHAGAQSMYYAVVDETLYFASSLTLLERLPFTIDPDSVSDFLHFLYVPAPRTIYKEVRSILPGQCISYDGRTVTEADLRWVSSPGAELKESLAEEAYVNAFEQFLVNSIRNSCVGQGKIGLFLSGGKDSSALAIALHLAGIENVEAVTLGFEEQKLDESKDAEIVARYLGIDFRSLRFSRKQYLENWPEFLRSLGQPVGDFAALPIFSAVKELGGAVGFFLDGTGNDSYLGIPASLQEDIAWYLHRLAPGLHHLPWRIAERGWSYTIDFLGQILGRPREEQFVSWNGWTDKEICRLTGKKPEWHKGRLYKFYGACPSPMIHKTMTLCGIWEPEAAYRKVVQVVNAAGKSVRYPFLDHDLVSFCRNLPESWQHSGRTNKIILRRLLKKYLPQQILAKKKGAFNFPKAYILASNNYEMIARFLSPDCIRKHGWVDPAVVEEYANRYKKGDTSLEDRLWSLIMLHAWAELKCD